ncbi:MAG: ROK family transcriptional regulator [Rhizobiales bacterium]|nr:ROK family transcriptional regulator [Hyphomicrobiales bacterium]
MRRAVSDTDTIKRQNRGLVLDAIRRLGPLSRTQIAQETGLSHASITTITADMAQQTILLELEESTKNKKGKSRGRPAIKMGFSRVAAYVILIEIDVNHARCSLVDYGGTLVDRIESPLTPESFAQQIPSDFIAELIERMQERTPEAANRIYRGAASIQGILDRAAAGLQWSPVVGLAGHNISDVIAHRFEFPLKLYKRGHMLAEGTRRLFPELETANVATVFIGSTVGMGISFHNENPDNNPRGVENTGTEFGHMIHIPDGALCRCGTSGCIEAYAADYGVLRSAYGVPDKTPPAAAVPPNQYTQLLDRARSGDRSALHAFNIAGKAIGLGLNRLMTVYDPSHIVIMGPGARAFPFMESELMSALSASLMNKIHGMPKFLTHEDESEPVFKGLMMKALTDLDQIEFASLPIQDNRMVAR